MSFPGIEHFSQWRTQYNLKYNFEDVVQYTKTPLHRQILKHLLKYIFIIIPGKKQTQTKQL